MPRYERGQVVRVSPLIRNRHVGQFGTVIEVKPDKRGKRMLDKYVLKFPDNDQEEFWEIQLEMKSTMYWE